MPAGLLALAAWWAGLSTCCAAAILTPAVREAFDRANVHYRQERYAEALEGYRGLLAGGIENGTLYYNLGNALLKTGRKGEALWAYLSARRFLPRDGDLRANLEYTRSLLSEAEPASVQAPRVADWLTANQQFSTRELAEAASALLWVASLCWIISGWVRWVRGALRPAAWTAFGCAAVVGVALVSQTLWVDAVPRAVAVADRAEAKFSPSDTGTTHFTLPEGAVVRALQSQGGWVQVRRRDGRTGWVAQAAVRPLR